MAVRKKPAFRAVLPVGLVASGLTGVAPAPASAPAPVEAVAASAPKKNWKAGKQGRVKLARAMRFKISKNEENMATIDNFPFGAYCDVVSEDASPLHELRQGPKWIVCRMAMFLLQMVMNLTKSYVPNADLEFKFGAGLQTAPRMALLMHHEESIEGVWKKQLCRGRQFFARALKEGENLKVFTGGVMTSNPEGEWREHMLEDTREKCKQLIQDNAEHYTATGMIAKVDNTKAYENMMSHQSWEAGLIYAVHVGCNFYWDRVCTAACIHSCSSGLVGEARWAGIGCDF
jgi:hypothetical protein